MQIQIVTKNGVPVSPQKVYCATEEAIKAVFNNAFSINYNLYGTYGTYNVQYDMHSTKTTIYNAPSIWVSLRCSPTSIKWVFYRNGFIKERVMRKLNNED